MTSRLVLTLLDRRAVGRWMLHYLELSLAIYGTHNPTPLRTWWEDLTEAADAGLDTAPDRSVRV